VNRLHLRLPLDVQLPEPHYATYDDNNPNALNLPLLPDETPVQEVTTTKTWDEEDSGQPPF
jgi:hypothetical protein